jgi:hypothetical protein
MQAKRSLRLTYVLCGLLLLVAVASTVALIVLARVPENVGFDRPSQVESWIQYDGNYYRFGLFVPLKKKTRRVEHPQTFLYFHSVMHKGTDVDPDDTSSAVGWGAGFKEISGGDDDVVQSLEYRDGDGNFYINGKAYPLADKGNVFLIFVDDASGTNVTKLEVDLSDVSIHVGDPADGFSDEDMTLTRASVEAFAIQNEDVVTFFQKVSESQL